MGDGSDLEEDNKALLVSRPESPHRKIQQNSSKSQGNLCTTSATTASLMAHYAALVNNYNSTLKKLQLPKWTEVLLSNTSIFSNPPQSFSTPDIYQWKTPVEGPQGYPGSQPVKRAVARAVAVPINAASQGLRDKQGPKHVTRHAQTLVM